MYKKMIFTLICSSFANISVAAITCPDVKATAVCKNGEWQVTIQPVEDQAWFQKSPDIKGQACQSDNEKTQNVKWNHAYQATRLYGVACNFSLLDNHMNEIGKINLMAYDTVYVRTGDNWIPAGYPGNWKCTEGRENCLFQRRDDIAK